MDCRKAFVSFVFSIFLAGQIVFASEALSAAAASFTHDSDTDTETPSTKRQRVGAASSAAAAAAAAQYSPDDDESSISREAVIGASSAAAAAAAAQDSSDDDESSISREALTGASSAAAAAAQYSPDDDESSIVREALTGKQVYANPIFDAAAKHLLADDEIRLGFMRTFTKNPDIVSTELLDTSLNPLRTLTRARDFLGNKKNGELMKRLSKTTDAARITVSVEAAGDGKGEIIEEGGAFLLNLSKIFSDLKKQFPSPDRNSQLDVVCKLNNGEFVLVEIQVKHQDFWDRRALCYAAAFYGNQLKRSGEWGTLKNVIAINLLGGESQHWREAPLELTRHYKFVSTVGDQHHEIDALQLVQYNLLSPQIEGLSEVALREWLQFWKAAHRRQPEEVAAIQTEDVKKAYHRVKVADLPAKIRGGYDRQLPDFLRYSQHIQQEKAASHQQGVEEGELRGELKGELKGELRGELKGKLETAANLLAMGIPEEQILKATQLTSAQFATLQQQKKPMEE